MSDAETVAAPAAAVEADVNEVVDPETGQKMSKNAFKKLQKKREADKKKAEKAAAKSAAAPAGEKKESVLAGGERDDQLDPSQYFEMRSLAMNRLDAAALAGDANAKTPWPHKFKVEKTIPEFVAEYSSIVDGERLETSVSVAGRIMRKAGQGKLVFYDLVGTNTKIQVMSDPGIYAGGEAEWERIHSLLRRGDIVGIVGAPGKSKRGELSIFPSAIELLSPCLHMLPKGQGAMVVTNPEVRFRKRYLDLMVNDGSHEIFATRAKIVSGIRRYLDDRGFLEVETPMMNMIPGGAIAKPFQTYFNELGMNVFMRIAPELNLKQCVIGGLDRVYEIGRQFRNEGMDLTHNPEFTTCEFYMAYADYNDLMDMTEEMISQMVLSIHGSYEVIYENREGTPLKIDFSPPWPRIPLLEGLREELGKRGVAFSIDKSSDLDEPDAVAKLLATHKEAKIELCKPPFTVARLTDNLVGELLEPLCVSPAFITEHPTAMSPLAKYHRSKPGVVERFELFVAGKELVNAYTELNNPFVQRERFNQQAGDVDAGDDEAMPKDEDFCVALEHGLPPTGGWGCGIDRLTMFLTNKNSIREVLLFPAMKPHSDAPAPPPPDHIQVEKLKAQLKAAGLKPCV